MARERADRRSALPVLYFHDGQNVFDGGTSFSGVEWDADEALEQLAQEGCEAIAVAVAQRGDDA